MAAAADLMTPAHAPRFAGRHGPSIVTGVGYAYGGYIPAPRGSEHTPGFYLLDPDECILNRAGRCQRHDEAHYRERIEIFSDQHPEPVGFHWGPCHHRHPLPVEDVTGEIVAYLCTHCDSQLPV